MNTLIITREDRAIIARPIAYRNNKIPMLVQEFVECLLRCA